MERTTDPRKGYEACRVYESINRGPLAAGDGPRPGPHGQTFSSEDKK